MQYEYITVRHNMSSSNIKKAASFGDILRIALENEGISQVELARMINKNQSQISRWINNASEPQYKTVKSISHVLQGEIYSDSNKWIYSERINKQVEDDPDTYNIKSDNEKDAVIRRLEAQVDTLMDIIVKMRNQINGDK